MRIRISFFDQSKFHILDREAPIFLYPVCNREKEKGVNSRSRTRDREMAAGDLKESGGGLSCRKERTRSQLPLIRRDFE